MSSITRPLRWLALPALLVAFGCASTSSTPAADPAESKPAVPTAETPDSGKVTIGKASSQALVPVYFDTDRALLRSDAREALKHYARSIIDHPEWGALTIDGHCDERGSEEYNLALGDRRAAAVKRYLVVLGVPPSRLATRSFGEDKPAVAGHDEEAWHHNRRTEFEAQSRESASR